MVFEEQSAVPVTARPGTFELSPRSTAVIVVDMQHDFASPDGMFGRAGIPLDGIQSVVEPTRRVLDAAREAGILVVYLTMQFDEDLADLGTANAPNRLRHLAMGVGQAVDAPDGTSSRVLVRDTWNTRIIEELAPQAGDVVIAKHRYSGFFETDLDEVLRSRGITSLIFTGCTTSVCVESTLRDAFYRDYQCLLLTDCCAEAVGSDQERTNHDASLTVIEGPS
jgi:ureidoacrylate peracid hydrolase